jgi:propionyl-CoA carboxylase alpha chain
VQLTVLDTQIQGENGHFGPRVRLDVEHDGLRAAYEVHVVGDRFYVDGPDGASTLVEQPRFPEPTANVQPGSLTAAMPGSVTRIAVAEGDAVTTGQLVLVLEAMKMEHPVLAPTDGVVETLAVEVGQQVETGAVLAVVTESDEEKRDAS